MLFLPEHIVMIERGAKTATRRVWKKPHAKVGGSYKTKTKMISKGYYQIIECLKLYEQRLGDMTERDAKKEGEYTLKEFKEVWAGLNGSWDDDFVVTVVEFEKISCGNTDIPDITAGVQD